jgi:Flp pilus assembly protein TadD
MDTVGWVLASQQRYEESVRYLRDARLRAPNNAEIRWHLAYVLSKMDRRGEAADELGAALAMPGEFSWRSQASALLTELAGK